MKSIIILFVVLLFQACNMFEKDEKILAEHENSSGETIKVCYVGLGATTNDVIQVKKSNQQKPLWVSEKYNYLQSSKLITDTSLQLVLSDTGYHNHNNKLDTIIINVK